MQIYSGLDSKMFFIIPNLKLSTTKDFQAPDNILFIISRSMWLMISCSTVNDFANEYFL